MKSKGLWWLGWIAALTLAMSMSALAQDTGQLHLSGLINDYTPATITVPPNSLGPWELRGEWTMTVKRNSGKADFSAALNMVRSDYWVLQNGNPDDPDARDPHTHHIALVDGDVMPIANGFRVTGTAAVTGNGSPAKFGLLSPLQIDVTGGSIVPFSNINLTFGNPAAKHLGTEPLSGIVRIRTEEEDRGVSVHPTAWIAPAGSHDAEEDCMEHMEKHAKTETQRPSTRAEALGRDEKLWGKMVKE